MKINPAPLHLTQAIVTGLVVALSVAVLGTSAHTLDVFNKQHTTNPWWMILLPQHFDTHGTKALVASSVVTLVLCGAFLIASFVPKLALRQKHTLRALLSLATILPSFLLSLVSVVWVHILNHNAPASDTIQTWTCGFKSMQATLQNMDVPDDMSNRGFKSLCMESKFALYGTLTAFLLLGISMGLTMVTWLADKWAARQQRKEGVEMGSVPS